MSLFRLYYFPDDLWQLFSAVDDMGHGDRGVGARGLCTDDIFQDNSYLSLGMMFLYT